MLSSGMRGAMPREMLDELYYQTGRIFLIELSLAFESPKNKFIVLMDDKEPPLFFLINSKRRGLDRNHDIELHNTNYSFLSKPVSYLDFDATYESYDETAPLPTRQQILDLLAKEPDRYMGILRKKDAEDLLYGLTNLDTAIETDDLNRIVAGLEEFIKN